MLHVMANQMAGPLRGEPFSIHVDEAVLADLRDRIRRTRLPDQVDPAFQSSGFGADEFWVAQCVCDEGDSFVGGDEGDCELAGVAPAEWFELFLRDHYQASQHGRGLTGNARGVQPFLATDHPDVGDAGRPGRQRSPGTLLPYPRARRRRSAWSRRPRHRQHLSLIAVGGSSTRRTTETTTSRP
jgi:hypothetical protein